MRKKMIAWINKYIDKEKKVGKIFINKIENKYEIKDEKS